MVKNFILCLILLMFIVSCENEVNNSNDEKNTNDEGDVKNDQDIAETDDLDDEKTITDEDAQIDEESDDFIEPDDNEIIEVDDDAEFQDEKDCNQKLEIGFDSYAYLKMSGIIQFSGNLFNATISSSNLKGDVEEIKFENGEYIYSGSITARLQNAKTVESEKYGTIIEKDEATFRFSPGLIDKMLDVGGYGADFISTRSFFSLNTTKEVLRKKCYTATDILWDYEDPYLVAIIDIPLGRIRGCFDGKRDFKAGDFLEMQFLNRIDTLPDKILERINWVSWDKSLEYGDDGFQNICACYNENGPTSGLPTYAHDPNEVKCWEYDGPGGSEEKPDYVND